MAGPLAGIAIRYVAQRVGGYAIKTVAKQYGKRTHRQRMMREGARRGSVPLAPAPQGPYHMGHQMRKSTRGEDRVTTRTPTARKTMRGGSAQRGTRAGSSRFRRDEERYRGRRY